MWEMLSLLIAEQANMKNALKRLWQTVPEFWSNLWKSSLFNVSFLDCNTLLENSYILREEHNSLTPKWCIKVVWGAIQTENQDFDAIL